MGCSHVRSQVGVAVWLTLAAACGSTGSHGKKADSDAATTDPDAGMSSSSDAAVTVQPIIPWKEGNSWTYRVVIDGVETTKVMTIGPEEMVGIGPNTQKLAHKVITKKGATDQTISWQTFVDGRVIRYREQSFGAKTGALQLDEYWDPYKLHIDGTPEHTQANASWLEIYQETKVPTGGTMTTSEERDAWTLDSPAEKVTVPAGTFTALVFQKAGGSDLKTYWYVPGIGKIKETGGQTEELVSFEVHP